MQACSEAPKLPVHPSMSLGPLPTQWQKIIRSLASLGYFPTPLSSYPSNQHKSSQRQRQKELHKEKVFPTTQEIRYPWVMWVFFLAVGPAIHCLHNILSCLVISMRSPWPPSPGTRRLIWWQEMAIWVSVTPIIKRPHYSHLYIF